jgi:hypothetical protein
MFHQGMFELILLTNQLKQFNVFSITFQSGKKLSSTDVYIEQGYHLTYTVYSGSIHIAYEINAIIMILKDNK